MAEQNEDEMIMVYNFYNHLMSLEGKKKFVKLHGKAINKKFKELYMKHDKAVRIATFVLTEQTLCQDVRGVANYLAAEAMIDVAHEVGYTPDGKKKERVRRDDPVLSKKQVIQLLILIG